MASTRDELLGACLQGDPAVSPPRVRGGCELRRGRRAELGRAGAGRAGYR